VGSQEFGAVLERGSRGLVVDPEALREELATPDGRVVLAANQLSQAVALLIGEAPKATEESTIDQDGPQAKAGFQSFEEGDDKPSKP